MDAKDRLRQYLEQRRDMGERELVLDELTVDEVMRIVGAKDGGAGTRSGRSVEREVRVPMAVPPASAQGVVAPPIVARPAAAPVTRPASPTPVAAETFAPPPKATPEPAKDAAWPAGLVVGRLNAELFGGPLASLVTLDDVARTTAACTRCPLSATAISNVPGEGSPTAKLVCVGEAPGAREDETGRPFVGRAGQLLDKILGAIGLAREEVFICNVLKHRPPENRNPRPEEVAACSPFLVRQLEIIRPRVIVAFGTFAAQTLLETTLAIGKLRGQVHRYYGVPLIVTYHPAALLRNPNWKRPTWDDVRYARRILDGTAPPPAAASRS